MKNDIIAAQTSAKHETIEGMEYVVDLMKVKKLFEMITDGESVGSSLTLGENCVFPRLVIHQYIKQDGYSRFYVYYIISYIIESNYKLIASSSEY